MSKLYPTNYFLCAFLVITVLGLSAVAALGQHGIRKIDFHNFTYPVYCGDDKKFDWMRVRNSHAVEGQGDEKIQFDILSVKFGDINGDGREEAIVRSTCNGGGTGHYFDGLIYTLRHGKPQLLTHISGGDRGNGGIHGLSTVRGLVVVELYANKVQGAGICCPDFIDTQRYRWNGRYLVPVGKRTRRAFKGWN